MNDGSTSALSDLQRAQLALVQAPLEHARSLPPWTYTGADFYAAEEEFVLRREWLSVGRTEDVPEPGDYFTTTVLREPLIVVRGEDGEIRALSAVCRHRSMIVASGRGRADRFVCPYHAWTYDTTGRLTAAAKMTGNTDFRKKDCALPKVRTEIWQGWIFVNFDVDAAPLGPRLKELDEILAPYRLAQLASAYAPIACDQHFNWKLLAPDNWENYHVLGVHAQSMLATGLFTPHTEFPWKAQDAYSIWLNPTKEGVDVPFALKTIPDLPPQLRRGFVGVHIFPCHIFLLSPENMLYYDVLPQSESHFRLEVRDCVLPEVARDPALEKAFAERRAGMEYIHFQEDVPALEGTQAGVRSSMAAQGHLSPDERPLWEFYNYLIPKVLEDVTHER